MFRSLRFFAPLLLACEISFAAEPIPVEQLPQPVIEAIQKRHPGSNMISAERDERNDFVYFFVDLESEGKNTRVEIDEYGRFADAP